MAGAVRKTCSASPDGLAPDTIARLFGCPDCPGMKNLSGFHLTFCYQIKRPMGKIIFLGGTGLLLYTLFKK